MLKRFGYRIGPVGRLAALLLAAAAAGGLFFFAYFSDSAFAQTRRPRRTVRPPAPARAAQFSHALKAHNLACASCHKFPSPNWKSVRPAAEAFPDITSYPTHQSCINCHRRDFFSGSRPAICSICHVTASPRGGARHPFPNPRETFDKSPKGKTATSDFIIDFPHDKHVDIVTGARIVSSPFRNVAFIRSGSGAAAPESCAVCHKTLQTQGDSADEFATMPPADLGDRFWLKKGTFKSSPIGHASCFTCHSQDSGMSPAPKDCATCHKLAGKEPAADFSPIVAREMNVSERVILDAWRTRHSSGKYRHEFAAHSELSCDTCHNVQTMKTSDFRTKKVEMSSCAMCHVTATAAEGGALTVEADARKKDQKFECSKCHVSYGKEPIPGSHLKALQDAGAN